MPIDSPLTLVELAERAPSEVRFDPPFLPEELSYTDRIRAWMEVEDACEALLLAGLRRQIGAEGDIAAAYQAWYESHAAEHHRALEHMCAEFNRRWYGNV